MAKKLTNKQIAMFARLHAAIHLSYFDQQGTDDIGVTEEEERLLVAAVHKVAETLAKGCPMNIGGNKEIIDYVRREF